MARTRTLALHAALVLGAAACDGSRPGPLPTPTPTPTPAVPGVVVGPGTGPSAITLIAADPQPGSEVAGCGAHASACAGRIRMAFRVTASASGTALTYVGFLHATDKTACLQGRGTGGALRAGDPQTVEIVFDVADSNPRCRVPLEFSHLAFVAEGTVEVASRQEWGLSYRLLP